MAYLFDWIQSVCFMSFCCMAIARALILYLRGVKAIAFNIERLAERLFDIACLGLIFIWGSGVLHHSHVVLEGFLPAFFLVKFVDLTIVKAIGAVLMLCGAIAYPIALICMGHSWRIGIDRSAPGALITSGIYAFSRNPIYLCFDMLLFGSFLIQGTPFCFLLTSSIAIMIHGIILREERFLKEHYADEYCNYCSRVGRYFTLT